MAYKVDDEVLVKARIKDIEIDTPHPFAIKSIDNYMPNKIAKCIYVREEDIVTNPAMTAEEAWEIAKKITIDPCAGGFNRKELDEIFEMRSYRDVMLNHTLQQAKEKIEAWEKSKKIQIGDEVDIFGDKGIVTSFGDDGDRLCVLYFDGHVGEYEIDSDIKKTGRHIDIQGLLEQIGGELEE